MTIHNIVKGASKIIPKRTRVLHNFGYLRIKIRLSRILVRSWHSRERLIKYRLIMITWLCVINCKHDKAALCQAAL